MAQRTFRLRRYHVAQNPNTKRTIVHLHGTERRLLGLIKVRRYENWHLEYVQGESEKAAVRRAIAVSPNRWTIPWLSGL